MIILPCIFLFLPFPVPLFFFSMITARASTSLNEKMSESLPFLPYPENLEGYVGDVGFDPFRFSDFAPMDFLREAELKHGRICMLGVVGYLTTAAGVRLPGDIDMSGTKFSDIGYGWDGSSQVPVAGALQVLAFVGFLELAVMKDITGGEFPGDFRNGAFDLGWDTFDEETKLQKRAIELNQGRAAMMGLLGLMVHDKLGNVENFFPN